MKINNEIKKKITGRRCSGRGSQPFGVAVNQGMDVGRAAARITPFAGNEEVSGSSCSRTLQLLLVEEPIHVVGGAGMEGVLFLLESCPIGQHVVSFRLLPQVIKLDQLANRTRPHLLLLDVVEIFAKHAQSRLEILALFFRPQRGRVAWRHVAHFPSSHSFVDVVAALQQLMQCLLMFIKSFKAKVNTIQSFDTVKLCILPVRRLLCVYPKGD